MLHGSPQLPKGIRNLLEEENNELFLSPISVWETLILAEKGRIRIEKEPHEWAREALKRSPVKEAALNCEVAFRSRKLNLSHNDPADRFIVATALVYDLYLVSTDKRLRKVQGVRTISR